jgi:hypothetical protein
MGEQKTTIVYMADDARPKGGFCDRMRAIIWLYSFSKKHGFDFKINFTHPFKLREYLKPNSYDWIYNENEVNTEHDTITLSIFSKTFKEHYGDSTVFCEYLYRGINESEMEILKYAHNYTKVLVYSNLFSEDTFPIYGDLFNELFCLAAILEEKLQYHIRQMGDKYVVAHFRFQVLLNDSSTEDPGHAATLPVLEADKQKELIRSCIKKIRKIHRMNPGHKVLVCSDSTNFIKVIKGLNYDYVYMLEGERKHLEVKGLDKEQVLLFLSDYFLLVFAKKIYSVIKKGMYPSGFSRYASLHNKVPCIVYDDRIPIWKIYPKRIIKKILRWA